VQILFVAVRLATYTHPKLLVLNSAGTLHDRSELEKARAAVLGSTVPTSPSRAASRQASTSDRHSSGPYHQGAPPEVPGSAHGVPDACVRLAGRASSLVRGDSAATAEAARGADHAGPAPPTGLTSRGSALLRSDSAGEVTLEGRLSGGPQHGQDLLNELD
jgi:hypothetical protein